MNFIQIIFLDKKPRTFYSKDTKFNDGDSIPLELGERIRLRCNFKGNPKPNIAWYKNEKMIDSDEMDSNESLPRMKITTKRYITNGCIFTKFEIFTTKHQQVYQ